MKPDTASKQNLLQWLKKNRTPVVLFFVILTAALVRLIAFPAHPAGLNQDEASIGYDTYALLHYGIDRNGCTLPVHLMAWGSGQNALYAYFSMPFVAIFGLNVFSIRLVNLIFSLLSVLAVYSMFTRSYGERAGLTAAALTAISPWNIMLSRWSLESNLFPSMLILCLWAICRSLDKRRYLWLAALLLALSLYAYGSAYLVITLFCVLLAMAYFTVCAVNGTLANGKKIREQLPLRSMILPAVLFAVVALPIYLFMYVNVFDKETIRIGLLTIPHTYGGRIASSSGTTLHDAVSHAIQLCLMQTDGADRNAFPFYGCIYVISLPFMLLGGFRAIKSHKPLDVLLLMLSACSLLLFAYYADPNINRVNAVYVPMLLLTALGVHEIAGSKKALAAIAAAYGICFCGFVSSYFSTDYREKIGGEFYESFGEAIEKADEITPANVTRYCTAQLNMPYIFTLFYTQIDPHVFVDTVQYSNPGEQFQTVTAYDNYVFNHDAVNSGKAGTYIIGNSDLETIRKFTDEIYQFKRYSVAVIR